MLKSMKLLLPLFALTLAAQPVAAIFGAAGPDAAAIRATVTAFQDNMGPLNAPGPNGDPNGRREINWDGVPAELSFPNKLPADFFNRNSVRGLMLTVDGMPNATFQVNSSPNPFSPEKVFYTVETNEYNFDFYVPGTQVKGKTKGFGIVFTNVALPFTTSIELFNADGLSLGRYYAPVAAKGLSFIGVTFPNKMITRVRVVPGNAAIGNTDDPANGKNVVFVDDVLYGEPVSDCLLN